MAGSGDTCLVILALRKLRQGGLMFKVSLGGSRQRKQRVQASGYMD